MHLLNATLLRRKNKKNLKKKNMGHLEFQLSVDYVPRKPYAYLAACGSKGYYRRVLFETKEGGFNGIAKEYMF